MKEGVSSHLVAPASTKPPLSLRFRTLLEGIAMGVQCATVGWALLMTETYSSCRLTNHLSNSSSHRDTPRRHEAGMGCSRNQGTAS